MVSSEKAPIKALKIKSLPFLCYSLEGFGRFHASSLCGRSAVTQKQHSSFHTSSPNLRAIHKTPFYISGWIQLPNNRIKHNHGVKHDRGDGYFRRGTAREQESLRYGENRPVFLRVDGRRPGCCMEREAGDGAAREYAVYNRGSNFGQKCHRGGENSGHRFQRWVSAR